MISERTLSLSASAHFGTTITLLMKPTIAGPSTSETSTEWPSSEALCHARLR